jgi:hypothetical protein
MGIRFNQWQEILREQMTYPGIYLWLFFVYLVALLFLLLALLAQGINQ